MKTVILVSSLFLASLVLGASESVTGAVDLAFSGSRLSSFGWAKVQEPIRGRTLKGTHAIYDTASYAMVGWAPYAVECTSNAFGVVSCQYQQNLLAGGSPGRCYRASLTAASYTPAGDRMAWNTFGSSMSCLPVGGDPVCPGDGGPIPTSADATGPLAGGRGSPERLDLRDASGEGEPGREPVTLQGAKGCGSSPIVIDLENEGFPLSDDPVAFDLDGDGMAEKTNWTAAGSSVAFLVLDRDGSGAIDSGRELFGNNTPLSTGEKAQYGYIALAEYDLEAFGDNVDGFIGPEDSVWSKLRLWVDRDHDGVSRPGELLTLDQAGILKLEYDYQISKRQDRYGNRFLAKGKAWRENPRGKEKEIRLWDVWFLRR